MPLSVLVWVPDHANYFSIINKTVKRKFSFLISYLISWLPNLCTDPPRIGSFYFVGAFCQQDVTVLEIRGR